MSQTIVIDSRGVPSRYRVSKDEESTIQVKYDFGLFFGSDTAASVEVDADSNLGASATLSGNVATVTLSGGNGGSSYDLTVKVAGTSETLRVVSHVAVTDYDTWPVNDYNWPRVC